MIQGLRTAIYHVDDLAKAKAWYSKVLGTDPYFDQPFYAGFSVGGFELGLLPEGARGPGGTVAYWGVFNADQAVARLVELGGKVKEPVTDVGEGIRVATITDPFGNDFGVIENPHFDKAAVR
jgi:predicted enzyme related to lactoylglutathione lyase